VKLRCHTLTTMKAPVITAHSVSYLLRLVTHSNNHACFHLNKHHNTHNDTKMHIPLCHRSRVQGKVLLLLLQLLGIQIGVCWQEQTPMNSQRKELQSSRASCTTALMYSKPLLRTMNNGGTIYLWTYYQSVRRSSSTTSNYNCLGNRLPLTLSLCGRCVRSVRQQ
jgi:hypothetical protein